MHVGERANTRIRDPGRTKLSIARAPKTRQKRAGYAMRMPGRARAPDMRAIAPHAAELEFYFRGCAFARLAERGGQSDQFPRRCESGRV